MPDPTLTPGLAPLQAIARQEGVAEDVSFVGRRGRDVLKHYYNAADIFVTTPWYEPFGITPVEAMACGTPVVGSNVGGIKFTIRDNETGYLIPPKDPEALAERLAHLYRHPKLLQLFGRQAIRRATDLFSWQRVTEMMAKLYEDVLGAAQCSVEQKDDHLAIIDRSFAELVTTAQQARERLRDKIAEAALLLHGCFQRGGKALICGNGGSAAEAQHWAAELVGRFKRSDRPGLPALALTADTAFLTAWSNDTSYEDIFARQIAAFGRNGDVLVTLSTSGCSRNLIHACKVARRQGMHSLALLGGTGGEVMALADVALLVPSTDTQHVQEPQLVLIHLICELIEEQMVSKAEATATRQVVAPLMRKVPQRRRQQARRVGTSA